MAKQAKIPFNCLLPIETLRAIREAATTDRCSQADVVIRAVALMVFGEEIKPALRQKFDSFTERANSWRSNRAPLLKPSQRKEK